MRNAVTTLISSQKKTGGSSKYRGVYWNKSMGKWMAQIWHNGKQQFIGLFAEEEEAAAAAAAAVEGEGEDTTEEGAKEAASADASAGEEKKEG